MPRKKLARRFDPRGGVSQSMLDAESRYVARELDDYLLWSITELREHLEQQRKKLAQAEENLQRCLGSLADRERLAVRCMLARDVFHVAALYETFFRSPQAPESVGTSRPTPEELTPENEVRPVFPFRESLFQF